MRCIASGLGVQADGGVQAVLASDPKKPPAKSAFLKGLCVCFAISSENGPVTCVPLRTAAVRIMKIKTPVQKQDSSSSFPDIRNEPPIDLRSRCYKSDPIAMVHHLLEPEVILAIRRIEPNTTIPGRSKSVFWRTNHLCCCLPRLFRVGTGIEVKLTKGCKNFWRGHPLDGDASVWNSMNSAMPR